jgi:hypothetical protein
MQCPQELVTVIVGKDDSNFVRVVTAKRAIPDKALLR